MKYYAFNLLILIMGASFIGTAMYTRAVVAARDLPPPDLEEVKAAPVVHIPDFRPVPENIRVSSRFGMRMHPIYKRKRMHYGIDFPIPIGTPVRASGAGTVEKVEYRSRSGGYGKHIVLCHDEAHSSLYAHLSSLWVTVGQEVARGDTIGLSGNTGVSTDPHLHFEVHKYGKHINPQELIKAF